MSKYWDRYWAQRSSRPKCGICHDVGKLYFDYYNHPEQWVACRYCKAGEAARKVTNEIEMARPT